MSGRARRRAGIATKLGNKQLPERPGFTAYLKKRRTLGKGPAMGTMLTARPSLYRSPPR